MTRARRKRAAISDIYPSCKIANNCPDDVVNKVEGNTIADRLLKWISSFLYFGGLGIGSGSGGAGRFVVGRGSLPAIAEVVPESLGPVESTVDIAGSTVDAESPALIPLQEVTVYAPEVSVIDSTGSLDTVVSTGTSAPPLTAPDPSVRGDLGTLASRVRIGDPSIRGDLQVLAARALNESAILEVTPEPPATRPTSVSHIEFHNPAFQPPLHAPTVTGESSISEDVLVFSFSGGQHIGPPPGEEIPLMDLRPDLLRPRATSTPEGTLPASRVRGDQRYLRRVQQVPVRDPTFPRTPSRHVYFDNPAFETSESIEYPVPATPQAAPTSDFHDIARLGHVLYGESATGHVRLSRLGTRGSIQTRSGLQIGAKVHFFHDVSTIGPDSFELQPIGEQSGTSTIVSGDTSGYEQIDLHDPTPPYPDEDLLDTYETISDSSRLVFNDTETSAGSSRLLLSSADRSNIIISDIEGPLDEGLNTAGYGVFVRDGDGNQPLPTPNHIDPYIPPIVIIDLTSTSIDYFLHPSLAKRRRRRAHWSFLADVGLAT
ncbi:L2 [Trichechus manatus latirostris papillomavirus 2]|uniref:Minor capsid protein L2 n=1 Tax=Trichechus manatus latirostris papillomavirus 2 TaxID=1144379 RepID=H6UYR0_9PAPI|nr:L2 gene product [Trichechus manatus latirostris papillomavirus 2]AFA26600.1 L2 [Trichechus manatus latirostris papillomavirus 2]